MITRYIQRYLAISQAKIIVWGLFLVPYVLVIIFYSGVLPRSVQIWIQTLIYSISLALSNILSRPTMGQGTAQVLPPETDPELLTIGYFVVTYLWSCILVENFGTISLSLRHKSAKRRKRHNGK